MDHATRWQARHVSATARIITILGIIALSLVALASAQPSAETIVVRVASVDAQARSYTFSCAIPAGYGPERTWSLRPDGGTTQTEVVNSQQTLTTTLPLNDLYHIGCQVRDPSNAIVRGDFHVDLRTAPDPSRPKVTISSASGSAFTASCDPPQGTSRFSRKWYLLYASTGAETELTQYENQRTISHTVPQAGLWDIMCGIWDIDRQQWTQFGMPVEFFSSGPAYVPNAQGCVPGDACPGGSTTPPPNGTNTTNQSNTGGCFSTVATIPATCNGGSMTQDSFNGCRSLACGSGSSALTVLACDKPSSSSPQFFEMYRQGKTGTVPLEICLAGTCIKDNGYAKSGSFPVCSGNTTPPPPPPPPNGTNTTPPNGTGGSCASNVQGMPIICTGGAVSEDTFNGCRSVTCANGTDSLKVLACDKPTSSSPQFFEMYAQGKTGTKVSKLCLGATCISDNGYAKSGTYPICSGNTTPPPPNGTNTTPPNGTGNGTCYAKVVGMPVTCAGSVTQDTSSGACRTIVCASGSNSVQVLACDKPSSSSPQFFEMYKQSSTGASVQVCIAGTCIKDNGYAKSGTYPVCIGNGTAGENTPPQPPTWLEPSAGKNDMDPVDFHIHVFDMQDAEGDAHIATDFEMWDVSANERVWSSLFNTQIRTHIHNADGTFEGDLAGENALLNDREYKLRARFYANSPTSNVSAWSEWRQFRTKAATNSTPPPGSGPWATKPGYKVELVASGVSVPVNVVVAPDIYTHLPEGQRPLLYVTQLYGKLGMIRRDGTYVQYASDLLNYASFGSLPGSGETGVTGLYVDPVTGDLFASMVYNDPDAGKFKGKVERFITNDAGTTYTGRQVILTNLPVAPSHQVQSITRGPDGKLYLNTGDADDLGGAKNTSKLSGKVLRLNDDGSIPSDNPIPGSYVYAAGFRNPFGAAWRPGTSELFVTENGPDSDDGVHKVLRGQVKGWCCDTSQGMWHHWEQTRAPVQLAFDPANGGLPSENDGSLFVGLSGSTYTQGPSANAKRIVRFTLGADGSNQGVEDFVTYVGSGYSAPIGLAFGQGALYFTDLYGEQGFVGVGETLGNIYKVVPGNASGNGTGGGGEFSAALAPARWYPQGRNMIWECKQSNGVGPFKYDFVFGDGQQLTGMDSFSTYHTYPSAGTYTASCTVRDAGTGLSRTSSTSITLS